MKILLSILLVFVTTISCSVILGRQKCTYGPSYWCSNITNAKSCGAVRHCIKTVWEKQNVPEDTDSICQICLDMVKQARDQLESNETMEEIKEVFEGSCDLIPINIVRKECIRLADDFIPELVEALSSQMNPQVVCSTAGLCNNAAIDKLLAEHEAQNSQFSCDKCNDIGHAISHKFHTSSRDQVLDGFLGACRRLSTFTDACSSIVLTYFDQIYAELSKNLKADNICHMSGACASKFHNHAKVEIKTESNSGVIKTKDDVPCELCEQLVTHLRDVLVANTTEQEFKAVLMGLCSQTKTFKKECSSIVDQYYSIIYESLVNNLDANGVCFMIGVCHKGIDAPNHPHTPLLPPHQNTPPRRLLGQHEKTYTNEEIQSMVLPIDRLMGAKTSQGLVDGGEKCAICQYFLHFLQEELSDAKNEDEIKEAVKRTCNKLPNSIQSACDSFVDLYGDAIIALLVQEIDPRDICPQLRLCPKNMNLDVDIFAPEVVHVEVNEESSKPTCPLCELVVAQARTYIANEKTKDSAKKALEKVCKFLPPKPQLQCNDFIETYYDELLDKLLSDLTPKGVCELLKLCPATEKVDDDDFKVGIEKVNFIPHSIDTNEIPDFTADGQVIDTDSGECLLCTSVVGGAEPKITQGMSKQEIENVLMVECGKFGPYRKICDNFVQQNADEIVTLLQQKMSPKQICQKLSLCATADDLNIDEAVIINVVAIPVVEEKPKIVRVPLNNNKNINDDPICVLCEFIMTKLEQQLKDKKTQEEIKEAVENICTVMPKSVKKQCTKFIDQYAELILTLIGTVPPKELCVEMGLCMPAKKFKYLVGESECTWGPTHFCGDVKIAEKCNAVDYCKRQKVGAYAQ